MNLWLLPVGIPVPTPAERAVLRLALAGLYPPAIAARLGLDECEVAATLRRLAKMHVEVKPETTVEVEGVAHDRIRRDDAGYGHGLSLSDVRPTARSK